MRCTKIIKGCNTLAHMIQKKKCWLYQLTVVAWSPIRTYADLIKQHNIQFHAQRQIKHVDYYYYLILPYNHSRGDYAINERHSMPYNMHNVSTTLIWIHQNSSAIVRTRSYIRIRSLTLTPLRQLLPRRYRPTDTCYIRIIKTIHHCIKLPFNESWIVIKAELQI